MRCTTLKIRPRTILETKLTNHSSTVSLLNSNSSVKYMRQGTLYIGGVRALFVRNLLEGRSKWSASQASLHFLETRLRGSFGKGF